MLTDPEVVTNKKYLAVLDKVRDARLAFTKTNLHRGPQNEKMAKGIQDRHRDRMETLQRKILKIQNECPHPKKVRESKYWWCRACCSVVNPLIASVATET